MGVLSERIKREFMDDETRAKKNSPLWLHHCVEENNNGKITKTRFKRCVDAQKEIQARYESCLRVCASLARYAGSWHEYAKVIGANISLTDMSFTINDPRTGIFKKVRTYPSTGVYDD